MYFIKKCILGLYELSDITYKKYWNLQSSILFFLVVTNVISLSAVAANKAIMEMCHLNLSDIRKAVHNI